MNSKLKAFIVWAALPVLFCDLFLTVNLLYRDGTSSLPYLFRWNSQSFFLECSLVEATIGTLALWLLPIRRLIVAMIVGASIGIGFIGCYAWVAMTFFGGFEENIGIFLNSLLLLFPCFVAGLYAGYLRARDVSPRWGTLER